MEFYKSKYSNKKKSRKFSRRSDEPSPSFRNSRNNRGSRHSRGDSKGEPATVICADCGTECQIPFVPRTDKPVYCSDCFRQNKPQDSRNDRYSRDDRGSRYFRDDKSSHSSRDNSRPRKSNNDKFLKKQESFFSNGSEKFYASLKEKLFEILGGKICSNCGFRDERALGFSHKYDNEVFDNIRRGGGASSWGKYISEPELAREELIVLCLNCNEIRQPVSKPKKDSMRPKQKKHRFPR